jgi:RND family efflux transporter MFP subunit
MWKRALVSVFVLGGVALYVAIPTSNAESPATEASEPERAAVRVGVVEQAEAGRARHLSGVTRTVDRAQLGFTVSGRLDARPVEIGDHVAAGDLLARLDRAPLHHRVAAAKTALARVDAQLALSRKTQRRIGALADSASISEASRDDADSQVAVLEAARAAAQVDLAEAKRLLAEASLRAPFDAVVSEVRSEVGEYVQTGAPVVVLAGVGGIELEVDVPESLLVGLAAGDSVTLRIPGLSGTDDQGPDHQGCLVDGTITAVGHSAPAQGRLFPVLVRLAPSEDVIPGMAAELLLELPEPTAIAVPVEAVINPGGMHPSVLAFVDGHVSEVEIAVIRVEGRRAVVRGPLAIGDEVIVSGQAALGHGDPVEVVR